MKYIFGTVRDLRQWVEQVTAGWVERAESDVDTITQAIHAGDHPAWGTDWTDFLNSLPDLGELLIDF